jgi:hypothetical protein
LQDPPSTEEPDVPAIALRPLPVPLPSLHAHSPGEARVVAVDEPNAFPCRRCLRDAEPGELVVLLSYDPFTGDSPYRQAGPIFVHRDPCAASLDGELPDQLTRRLLSVRAFDREHLMLAGSVVPGAELRETAERLLADDAVDYLHVHNAGPGCFAVRIDRAARDAAGTAGSSVGGTGSSSGRGT